MSGQDTTKQWTGEVGFISDLITEYGLGSLKQAAASWPAQRITVCSLSMRWLAGLMLYMYDVPGV